MIYEGHSFTLDFKEYEERFNFASSKLEKQKQEEIGKLLNNKTQKNIEFVIRKALLCFNHKLNEIAPICYEISPFIKKELKKLGFKKENVKCIYTNKLPYRTNFYQHCFIILSDNNKIFLIDTTFFQFSEFENIWQMNGSGFSKTPYEFMSMDSTGLEIKKDLLEKGYTELTEEKLKKYLGIFIVREHNITINDLFSNEEFSLEESNKGCSIKKKTNYK
jgi:hypothetical protein